MILQTQISQIAKAIADRFHPEKIILFGSYAYGTPTEDSDVDLLVIMPFEGEAVLQALKIAHGTDPAIPLDVVVRRPEDALRRYKQFDPLVREAFDKGKILHE